MGLLYRDQFNRPDGAVGADWVVEAGSWSVTNNALQLALGAGQLATIRLGALADRKDFHVQVLSSRSQLTNYASIYSRRVGNTLFQADLGSTTDGTRAAVPRLYRETNGGYTALGYGSFTSSPGTFYRMTLSTIGNEQKLWADGALQVNANDATPANDINGNLSFIGYGQGASGTIRFDDLVVCSGRTVAVTGLPDGYRIRVGGIISNRAVSGGWVSLDLLATQLPAAQLEIIDATNTLVKIYTPDTGVWGGDSYSLNGAAPPPPPPPPASATITRTTSGLLFKDDFNRPDEQLVGAEKNWTRMGSPSIDSDWRVQGNQVKALSAGASATQAEVYPQGVNPQSGDVVVQSWFQRGNTAGRTGVTLVQAGEAGGILFIRDPFHGWELWNYGSGFYTNPANNTASTRESGVLKLRRNAGRYQAWVDGILLFDIAGDARLNTAPLYPALIQLQQPAAWDDYAGYAGNTVTITGLPAGYRLRIGGAISTMAVAGQPTTLDVGGLSFPVAQIEILESSGGLIMSYAPTNGVWGGDTYSFNSVP